MKSEKATDTQLPTNSTAVSGTIDARTDERAGHAQSTPGAVPNAMSTIESIQANRAVETEKPSKEASETHGANQLAPSGAEPSVKMSTESSSPGREGPDNQHQAPHPASTETAPKKKKKKEARVVAVRAKPLSEEELAMERERQERVRGGFPSRFSMLTRSCRKRLR